MAILTVAVTGAAAAGFAGLMIPPRYTAKAEIVIEPQQPAPGSGQAVVVAPQDQSFVQTQIAALSSRDHLRRVLVSLSQDPVFEAATELPHDGRAGLSVRLRAWVKEQWLSAAAPALNAVLAALDASRPAPSKPDPVGEVALEAFEKELVVAQEHGSQVVSAQYSATNPVRAALAANRVVQLFAQNQYDQKRENTNRTLSWISARIAELKRELERNDAALERYRVEHSLPGSKQTDVIDARIVELNHDLTAAQADLAASQARLDYISDTRHRSPGSVVANMDSPVLADLRHQEVVLRQSAADLTPSLGPSHPNVQRVLSQLQEVRRRIQLEADRSAASLRDDVRIATAKVHSLQDQLTAVQDAATKSRQAEVGLRELERQTNASRQLYESLSQRREQLQEQKEMISPDARILSLAAPPNRPSSPNPIILMLPAFVVFGMAGGLVAIGAERVSRGLRSARDVHEVLGIRCIGLIPRVRAIRRMRPHEQLLRRRFGAYTEAIRSIVATLQLASPALAPKVVLVTSSVPREGKTTLAVSFAVYAALVGRRVVLVDLDFRHPAVMRELGSHDVEESEIDPADIEDLSLTAIQNIPGLGIDLLPLRSPPDDPLTPFANGQLPRLIRSLRAQYDLVVIDGPPLLAVTEAQLLTAMVDRVLFAVRWGTTRQDVAQNALNLLRDPRLLGDELVSEMIAAVVTQVDLRRHARYRFGDTGESLMKFRQYYVDGPRWTTKKLGFVPRADAAPRAIDAGADSIISTPLDGGKN
ncbi:MAG: AAA family ATPase [Alphaproteobacteria bacterium]|nr:AAA family ATPase [Alphaproteobacteria bacterium]